jgi:hypothetical protein
LSDVVITNSLGRLQQTCSTRKFECELLRDDSVFLLDLLFDGKDRVGLLGIEGEKDNILNIGYLDENSSLDLNSLAILQTVVLDGLGVDELLGVEVESLLVLWDGLFLLDLVFDFKDGVGDLHNYIEDIVVLSLDVE